MILDAIKKNNENIINNLEQPLQSLSKDIDMYLKQCGIEAYLQELRNNHKIDYPSFTRSLINFINTEFKDTIRKNPGIVKKQIADNILCKEIHRINDFSYENKHILIKHFLDTLNTKERKKAKRILEVHETEIDLYYAQYKSIARGKADYPYDSLVPDLKNIVKECFIDDLEAHHKSQYRQLLPDLIRLDKISEAYNKAVKQNELIKKARDQDIPEEQIAFCMNEHYTMKQSEILIDSLMFEISFDDIKIYSDPKLNYKQMREGMFACIPEEKREYLSMLKDVKLNQFAGKYNTEISTLPVADKTVTHNMLQSMFNNCKTDYRIMRDTRVLHEKHQINDKQFMQLIMKNDAVYTSALLKQINTKQNITRK